jgi:hypothetical protein
MDEGKPVDRVLACAGQRRRVGLCNAFLTTLTRAICRLMGRGHAGRPCTCNWTSLAPITPDQTLKQSTCYIHTRFTTCIPAGVPTGGSVHPSLLAAQLNGLLSMATFDSTVHSQRPLH